MKKQFCAVLAILLAASMLLCGCEKTESAGNGLEPGSEANAADQTDRGAAKYEGEGYASPEEAIQAYIDALKEADFDKAVSVFAIESYAQGFSLEKALESPTYYVPPGNMLPDMGELSEGFNIASRYCDVCTTVAANVFVLTGKGQLAESKPNSISTGSAETRSAKVEAFLSSFPDEIEVKPLLASVSVGGASYYIAMDTIKYGGDWYLYGAGRSAGSLGQDCSNLRGAIAASDVGS